MPNFFTETIPNAWDSLTQSVSNLSDVGLRVGDVAFGSYETEDSTLGQNQYDFTSRKFPNNIDSEDQAHYMVININVPVRSGGIRTAFNVADSFQTLLPNESSKVDTLRFGNVESFGAAPRGTFSVPRYTRRIKESIAMYMPTPMVYTTMNQYEDVSMTAMAAGVGAAGLRAVAAGIGSVLGGAAGAAAAASGTGQVLDTAGNVISNVSKIAGYPINPRVEVLFSTTLQREFLFEFLLAPTNEDESKNLKEIIRTLRFHSAPEIDPAFAGLTYIPPAEFDITFYNKGVENSHIPRINTCVLARIDVDYAPFEGKYVTFKNGHPVGVRLSLAFRELEVNHKLRILQGF